MAGQVGHDEKGAGDDGWPIRSGMTRREPGMTEKRWIMVFKAASLTTLKGTVKEHVFLIVF